MSNTLVRVTSCPNPELEAYPTPWLYTYDSFISWVDEVFLEGYKRNNPMPTINEAINLVVANGYTVEIE